MHKTIKVLLFIYIGVLFLRLNLNAKEITSISTDTISIENKILQVGFELGTGYYFVREKVSGDILFRDATMQIGFWNISNKELVTNRYAEIFQVHDKLGKGQSLKIISKIIDKNRRWHPDSPGKFDLELTITLYEGMSGLILECGITNHLQRSILVKDFAPILNAQLWPGDKEHKNPLTLDGHGAYGGAREMINDTGAHGHAKEGRGQNAVMAGLSRSSENNLLLTYTNENKRRSFVAGGLTYHDFLKRVKVDTIDDQKVTASIKGYDPVGRMVDAGSHYHIPDRFYVDLTTSDPFKTLEQYAKVAACAQPAAPNLYNFPTVCLWYAMLTTGKNCNQTVGAVEEMKHAKESNFLRYSPVAIRLVPDKYLGNTEQGWWDDEHWHKFGHYKKPYETSEKYCHAIIDLGGLPFTYLQPGMPSDDFAKTHPEWMLNNNIKYLPLAHDHEKPYVRFDYSDSDFQEYVKNVWDTLRMAGLKGVMFDYPETGFAGEGGLENPYYTATAAYRKMFELARNGLGPHAFIHERNLGEVSTTTSLPHERIPFSDMTLGLADSQRNETDASWFNSSQVSRAALRWYKNRVFYSYDLDAKSLLFKDLGGNVDENIGDPIIRRRSILTMLYIVSGRILLADSFKDYSSQIIHDLSRLYPMHEERRTSRPVDLFKQSSYDCPRVYQFSVNPQWHQVTFFNPDMEKKATVSAPLSGDAVSSGALNLDPDSDYYVYDFWNNNLVGRYTGTDTLSLELIPGEARMLSVRETVSHPQILSSDRHIMQGLIELSDIHWDDIAKSLSGIVNVVADEPLRIIIANNGLIPLNAQSSDGMIEIEKSEENPNLTVLKLELSNNKRITWQINFQ